MATKYYRVEKEQTTRTSHVVQVDDVENIDEENYTLSEHLEGYGEEIDTRDAHDWDTEIDFYELSGEPDYIDCKMRIDEDGDLDW